ncbi:MAG: hypothetical protein ABW116_05685 [Candidatus Sedimenticola sp. 20ELBAFRAG]
MNRWFTVMGLLLLQGCATNVVYEQTSPWFYIPVGSVVELHEEIVVPPRYTRAYLQDGEVWGYGQVDKYYPFCNFEVRLRKETEPQSIMPERFIVTRVEQGWKTIVGLERPKLASALMRNRFRHWIIWKDGPGTINRYRHYWLGSDVQPNVMRITCYGGQDEPHEAVQPTLQEIRQVLGGKVTIHLNP